MTDCSRKTTSIVETPDDKLKDDLKSLRGPVFPKEIELALSPLGTFPGTDDLSAKTFKDVSISV